MNGVQLQKNLKILYIRKHHMKIQQECEIKQVTADPEPKHCNARFRRVAQISAGAKAMCMDHFSTSVQQIIFHPFGLLR